MQNQAAEATKRFAPYLWQQMRGIAKFNYKEPEYGPYKHIRLKEVVYTLAPLEHKGNDPFTMMKDIGPYLGHWWKKDGKWMFWFFWIPYVVNISYLEWGAWYDARKHRF